MANVIGNTIDNITQFIELKIEQLKLRIIERIAGTLSGVISLSFILVISFFFLFFLSFAFAYLINESLNSKYLGFFIVSGFYLVIILTVFILLKKKVIQGWFESFILNLADRKNDDEQD